MELNELFVDVSAGDEQVYEEDCQVCCRPNTIHVHIDQDNLHVTIDSEAEG